MEKVGENSSQDSLVVQRRARLAQLYESLPPYGSADFWSLLENSVEERQAVPLELLVKVLREGALASEDKQAQRRLFTVIVARVQEANEQWVHQVLSRVHVLAGERRAFAADLYADLCEQMLRACLNRDQSFWEESFQHALRFARKHVYESFLRRESRLPKLTPGPGERVPHALLESLDRAQWRANFEDEWDIPDERAERAFLLVEQGESVSLLFRLPIKLRAIVWLIFWEDCSTKTVGELLGISDRTVRNRLQAALAQLRRAFIEDQEVVDGASA